MQEATKAKKKTSSRPKLNFTVDRSEFDISSDWVQAVMGPPGAPPQPEQPFFSPPINNATDTLNATGVISLPEAENTPDVNNDGVANRAPVVSAERGGRTLSEDNATAATFRLREDPSVVNNATVVPACQVNNNTDAHNSPVVNNATVVNNSPRVWKLRPLRRITDGLTPGQYAVYSLMLENSEAGQGIADRIYRGGYADLCRLTGLSKRGVQNVIAELQEKTVIRLHTAPGHHRSQTSIYEVPQPTSVLEKWYATGWRFAAGKSKRLTQGATVAV